MLMMSDRGFFTLKCRPLTIADRAFTMVVGMYDWLIGQVVKILGLCRYFKGE